MSFLKETAQPIYRQIYFIMKEKIDNGYYKEGDLLPSEHQMCETYNVTRPTIRQCLGELVKEGYIKKIRGKGSMVHSSKIGIGILNVKGTTDSLSKRTLKTKVVSPPEIVDWPIGNDFDLSTREKTMQCIRLARLRSIKKEHIFYEETFLPNFKLDNFLEIDFTNKSLFGVLQKKYQLEVTGGSQKIWALKTEPKIKKLLAIASDQPILHLQKKYETNNPYFHFYTKLWCNTSNYYLEGAL